MQTTPYHPEPYWTRVAREIAARAGHNPLAGDNDPFHAYKRRMMLRKFLDPLDVAGKTVLEVGCGPGGNLGHLRARRNPPARLIGVDISQEMLDLARQRVPVDVELLKTDGSGVPLPDGTADLTFTCTALMHVTDPAMFGSLIADICRITRQTLVLIEPISHGAASAITDDRHATARMTDIYRQAVFAQGFRLRSVQPLRVRVSRKGASVIRRLIGRRGRQEGEPESRMCRLLQYGCLGMTRWVDDLVRDEHDIAMLTCIRE